MHRKIIESAAIFQIKQTLGFYNITSHLAKIERKDMD